MEAQWKSKLSDAERDELKRAKVAHTATGAVYRLLVRRLKDRCLKRLKRERSDG